jgi:YD repeat-containing protein
LTWQGTPNGDAYVQKIAGWLSLLAECPDKTQPIATYPADYQNTLVCRVPEIPHPDNCPNAPTIKVGNPIYAATGRKQQTESDYTSASGLTFNRIYRSDTNGWTHSQHYAGVDLNSPALELKPEYPPQLCYQGIGATTKLPYCFPYKRKNNSNDFALRRPDGRLVRFGSLNGMDAPADVNDRVVVIKDQNNQTIGWRVYNASTNAQETYDMLGRLLSSTNSQNQTVTYSYSDATTPANLAPKPGLLLSITDWQGRELKLSYDAKARLSSMTDPAGGVVTYAYDQASAIVIGSNPAASNLTSVTYPDGSKRLYHYNEPANTANTNLPNALTGLTDENGTRLARL